jgi:acyl-CoA dehydrogenase
MALRDAQLIPRLEGSTHINLALTAQFIPRYFTRSDTNLPEPGSLSADPTLRRENPYLITARAGAIHAIDFPFYLKAYRPLTALPNVRLFAVQASALRLFLRSACAQRALKAGGETALALGQCLATVAYAQLVAENAILLGIPHALISAMFELFVSDLSSSALALAGSPHVDSIGNVLIRRLVVPAKTTLAEWEAVAERAAAFGDPH